MRRSKQWWTTLTPDEHSLLVCMERAPKGLYLGDGYHGCAWCGWPCPILDRLCEGCLTDRQRLVDKADHATKAPEPDDQRAEDDRARGMEIDAELRQMGRR